MTREKLSKTEDRALQSALESVVLTAFPNPERKDCPGRETLRAIARKRLPMRDPVGDHVARCSPCFRELQEIRSEVRHKYVLWSVATATASILIVAVVLASVGFLSRAGGSSIPTPIQQAPQIAILDLRNFSVVRSQSPSSTAIEPLQLSRTALDLTIQLPVGAEAGPYELRIGKDERNPLVTAKGEARIENYVTTLRVRIDTSNIPPGDYQLGVRHADFNWRSYPLAFR